MTRLVPLARWWPNIRPVRLIEVQTERITELEKLIEKEASGCPVHQGNHKTQLEGAGRKGGDGYDTKTGRTLHRA